MELGCVVRSYIERQEQQKSTAKAPVSDNRTVRYLQLLYTGMVFRIQLVHQITSPPTDRLSGQLRLLRGREELW